MSLEPPGPEDAGSDATGSLPPEIETAFAADPLPHRLVTGLVKIGLAARHQAWVGAGAQGLSPTQGQILALLRLRPDVGLRLSALAEALAVTPATASVAVRALTGKGLVDKTPVPGDARAVALTLTPDGQREAARAAGWSDFLLAAVEALTPSEQETFFRGVVKMIRTLQERGEIPVSRMCVTCRFFRPNVHAHPEPPHHCAFVDAPFSDRHLRLECLDHQTASPAQARHAWDAFTAG